MDTKIGVIAIALAWSVMLGELMMPLAQTLQESTPQETQSSNDTTERLQQLDNSTP